MRRRRSTRSVIKLLAAAAVATASIVSLRLSTPPARGELPLAFCDDIEEIDTKVLAQPPRRGNAPEQLMDFLRTYKNEHRPGDDDDDDDEKEPIGQRKIVDGLFLPPRPLEPYRRPYRWHYRRPYRRSHRRKFPRRPYRRNLVIYALAFALAVLAMVRAAMAVRRWRRANAEVRRWRRARDHAS